MPPDDESPRGNPEGTANNKPTNETARQSGYLHSSVGPRQCAGDTVGVALRRRRRASLRMPPLGESGDIRDPHRRWRPEKLSEKQLDAAVAAAEHLTEAGLSPVFDVDTLRAMWRAGRRQLAENLRGAR